MNCFGSRGIVTQYAMPKYPLFELKHLRHYVTVVEEGKLLRAAETLHLSQPALTQSIQNLEEFAGVPLLIRLPRGVEPTEAGRHFYRYAKRTLGDSENVVRDVSLIAEGNLGHVHIGTSQLFTDQLMPEIVAKLIEDFPSLSFAVQEAAYNKLFEGLSSREIDIALTNFPAGTLSKEMEFEPLIALATTFIVGTSHPLASLKRVSADALKEARLTIIRKPKPGDFLDQLLNDYGVDTARAIESNSLPVLKRLVMSGKAVTFIPEHMFQDEIASGQVKALSLSGMPSIRHAGIVLRKTPDRRPHVELVAELIRKVCATWDDKHQKS